MSFGRWVIRTRRLMFQFSFHLPFVNFVAALAADVARTDVVCCKARTHRRANRRNALIKFAVSHCDTLRQLHVSRFHA